MDAKDNEERKTGSQESEDDVIIIDDDSDITEDNASDKTETCSARSSSSCKILSTHNRFTEEIISISSDESPHDTTDEACDSVRLQTAQEENMNDNDMTPGSSILGEDFVVTDEWGATKNDQEENLALLELLNKCVSNEDPIDEVPLRELDKSTSSKSNTEEDSSKSNTAGEFILQLLKKLAKTDNTTGQTSTESEDEEKE